MSKEGKLVEEQGGGEEDPDYSRRDCAFSKENCQLCRLTFRALLITSRRLLLGGGGGVGEAAAIEE